MEIGGSQAGMPCDIATEIVKEAESIPESLVKILHKKPCK